MPGVGGELLEAEWQKQVIDLAHLYGWRVAHFRAARTEHGWRTPVAADGAGFPDLVLVRGEELIFAELKSDSGRVRPEQTKWLDALADTGVTVRVWRPADFDRVRDELAPGPAARGTGQGSLLGGLAAA